MLAAITMGLGAAIWLAGELYAVFSGEHPTTWYVRTFQRRHWWVRLIVMAGLTWLALHFEANLP